MQKITLIGNISRDNEIRAIAGKDYNCFNIACDNGKDKEATFYRIQARTFGQNGIARFLVKGAKVAVVGRPTYDVYNDKAQVTVWADDVEMVKFAADDLPAGNDEEDAF